MAAAVRTHSRENSMVRSLSHWLLPVALLLTLGSALAQAGPSSAKPDPLDAQAAVPALVHSSALAAYRRHADAVPIAWKQANDTVTRIGGWRAYAREASAPAPAAAASGSKP
jgi:hypothetical protein